MRRSVLLYSAMIWGLAVAAFAWNGAGAAPETEPLGPTDGCPHTFDVLQYAITLAIDIENETVSGSAMIRCVAEEPDLVSIDLDFAVLTVDSVRSPDSALAFIHDEEVLTVNLQLLERNNRLLANNIANMDTPNFRPSHIDFERTLKIALRDGHLKPEGVEGGRTPRKPMRIFHERDMGAGRNDGNRVDIEDEMTRLATNTGKYNLYASLLKKRFQIAKDMLTRLR